MTNLLVSLFSMKVKIINNVEREFYYFVRTFVILENKTRGTYNKIELEL